MSILVNTRNEQEEKVLLAFLDSLSYKYQSGVKDEDQIKAYLDEYNEALNQADEEIEAGNYIKHEAVEQLFQKRRNSI